MKKKYILLFAFVVLLSALLLYFTHEPSSTVYPIQKTTTAPADEDEGPILWIGPGVYYRTWFGSEDEYKEWYEKHFDEHNNAQPSGENRQTQTPQKN